MAKGKWNHNKPSTPRKIGKWHAGINGKINDMLDSAKEKERNEDKDEDKDEDEELTASELYHIAYDKIDAITESDNRAIAIDEAQQAVNNVPDSHELKDFLQRRLDVYKVPFDYAMEYCSKCKHFTNKYDVKCADGWTMHVMGSNQYHDGKDCFGFKSKE